MYVNRRANGLLNSCLTWFTKVFLYKCSRTVPSKGIVNRVDCRNLYMAVNEIHHSQMHPTLTLVGVNEIHELMMIFMARLTRVTLHEGLDRGLELNSGLACHFSTSKPRFQPFQLTHYTLKFIFYKSFWGYWYLAWVVSSLLLWASTGNFS